jgi:hypothetical protein
MRFCLALPVEPEPENDSKTSGTESAQLKTDAFRDSLESSRRGRRQRRDADPHLHAGMSLTATLVCHCDSPAPVTHGHCSATPTPLRC